MKTCCKCGRTLDESMFTKNKKSSDGLFSYCKDCKREYDRAYQKTDKGKKAKAKASKTYRDKPETKMKQDARALVSLMVRCGMLVKPETCECCGEKAELFGHHWHGYEHEHWADVQWVCRSCHQKLETKEVTDGLSQA